MKKIQIFLFTFFPAGKYAINWFLKRFNELPWLYLRQSPKNCNSRVTAHIKLRHPLNITCTFSEHTRGAE